MTPTGRLKKPSLSHMCEWMWLHGTSYQKKWFPEFFKSYPFSTQDDAVWLTSPDSETSSDSDIDSNESRDEQ
jgi:hypothetical protein